MTLRIEVLHSTVNGSDVYDIYQIDKKPILQSGPNLFSEKQVILIEIHELTYTVAALIHYDDGSLQYTENVKRYYESRSTQGNTPDVL